MSDRKIIHVDMDAFFASVEQRDDPSLRGRPVIVGGDPGGRGVVAACSYEARAFGIHSAMPGKTAKKRCPEAVFIRPRFEVYRAVSREIHEVFRSVTPLVEPLSLDEAFLDVATNLRGEPSATILARTIKQEIRAATGLVASAGVSFNKFLAKVASDMDKPDGLYVITPEAAPAFVDALPIEKFYGIGKVTAGRMRALGITRGADLKAFGRARLVLEFGKVGHYFHDIAHGLDHRPVVTERIRKSLGKETTFAEDTVDLGVIGDVITTLSDKVASLLIERGLTGRTVTIKVKYHDFRQHTRQRRVPLPVDDARAIAEAATDLLARTDAGRVPVRLVGVTVSDFDNGQGEARQLSLHLAPPRSH